MAVVAVVVIGAGIWWYMSTGAADSTELEASVKSGDFDISITTTGELEPKSSVSISGPAGIEQFGIYQMKISDLVPEGKRVQKGDFVASLDPTEIVTKLKEADNDLTKLQAQYTQTQLDTNLTMRTTRDDLINLAFAVTERQLVLSQSKYEPPATIRQAEIDLEKAQRALKQARENYVIKRKQNTAKMQEVAASLATAQAKKDGISKFLDLLNIKAPAPGMVIYRKNWNGQKVVVGGTISSWDPTVAKLPDLDTMISTTYVNEVDVRRIKTGQEVNIGLDAVPEKKLKGKVFSVANVGEQRPNSDAKVFEVKILLSQRDTTLRPSMTTSNRIQIGMIKGALSVPLDAIHSGADSLKFVYKKDGIKVVRQEVRTGEANDDAIVIQAGLKADDKVLLSEPKDGEKLELIKLATDTKTKR